MSALINQRDLINIHAGVAFWAETGERQTARLRVKYIHSVLKQDMSFFDTVATNENLLQCISSDAILVQDAIADKVNVSTKIYRYVSKVLQGTIYA